MQKDLPLYQIFQQVFFQYYKPLCQYAFTFIKETQTCEDIVQEIFLRVWEKKQDLLAKNEIKFYLFTAVHNNCLTSIDKKKRSIFTPLTGQEREPVDGYPRGENEPDLTSLVVVALDRLPPKCREIFILSRMGKLTYQQIAETSGISVKTVENQMGKALRIMRSFIKEKEAHVINVLLFFSLMAHLQ